MGSSYLLTFCGRIKIVMTPNSEHGIWYTRRKGLGCGWYRAYIYINTYMDIDMRMVFYGVINGYYPQNRELNGKEHGHDMDAGFVGFLL